MKRWIWVVCIAMGCDSKGKQCQKALDWMLEQAPKEIDKSVAARPEQADAVRADGAKEVAAMRKNFVDACKSEDAFDLDCYLDPVKHQTEACKNMGNRIQTKVQAP
jgi:hypothetical protein